MPLSDILGMFKKQEEQRQISEQTQNEVQEILKHFSEEEKAAMAKELGQSYEPRKEEQKQSQSVTETPKESTEQPKPEITQQPEKVVSYMPSGNNESNSPTQTGEITWDSLLALKNETLKEGTLEAVERYEKYLEDNKEKVGELINQDFRTPLI